MSVFAIHSVVVLFRVRFAPRFRSSVILGLGAHVKDLGLGLSEKSMANTTASSFRELAVDVGCVVVI